MGDMISYFDKFSNSIQTPVFKQHIDDIIGKNIKQIHLIKARDRSNTFNFKNNVFNYKANEEKTINIPKNNPLASMGKQFNKFDLFNK